MAVMIPSLMPASAPPGEREVFSRLRDDPNTSNWVVLHSLDIAKHSTQVSGEADFVILVPQCGVLVAEVKSHSHIVRGEDGIWYYGHSTAGETRGPFRQAADAMHSLRAVVRERCPDLTGVLFWSCAIFPYASGRIVSGEWHSWQLIDSGKFRSLPLSRLIESVLSSAKEHLCAHAPGWRWNSQGPTQDDAKRIATALRPKFEAIQSPTARAKNIKTELSHYTGEQTEVLDTMSANKRLVVHGPAGTGKTLLAIEATRRGVEAGRKTALICFNRLLANRLTESAPKCESLKVGSLHKLMCDVAGVKAPNDASNDWWTGELPDLAVGKLLERGARPFFDELILDEFQDILRTPYLDFLDLALAGGLAAGRWRAFGDFERQAIFASADSLSFEEFIEKRSGNAATFHLAINCRNLPRVAKHVEILGKLSPAYRRVRRGDDGADPEFLFHSNEEQQEANLRRLLLRFESDGYSRNEIVILSPVKSSAGSRIYARDGKNSVLQPFPSARNDCAQFTTIHAFKGLEASIIVLTDIADVQTNEASDLFYVGVSRSVHRLAVCATSAITMDLLEILKP